MLPILFTLGKVVIHSYTILLDLGLVLGLVVAYWLWRRRKGTPQVFLDAVTWTLLGAVVGGRAAYVVVNWVYFSQHLSESLAIWTGGMSFHGAFAGGSLALIVYSLVSRRASWQLADILAVGLAAGGILGWLACFVSGCAYGIVGDGPLFLLSPDIYGVEAPRFALQLVGAAQSLALFVLLFGLLQLQVRAGTLCCLYVILYFGGQFGLEFLRGDGSVFLGVWRVGQVTDVLFVLAGIAALILLRSGIIGDRSDYPVEGEVQREEQ
jgi:phosphatidylglycerol---prolipoprotein diacylglyceryl transferase